MALRQTRLIAKVFQSRFAVLTHCHRYQSSDTGGAPYRPWPMTEYTYGESAKHWIGEGYKPASEEDDQYEKEELYLSEIEERLRKYDKKYSDSDKIKSLYNEFGFEDIEDKAYQNYGSTEGGDQYGPGKKLDPAHYVNAEWCNVDRRPIAPIQFLTAEQIRRSRGSYASHRELPPEMPSIWKYWNVYTCVGAFTFIFVSKEWLITGGHELFDAALLWGFFGLHAAVVSDWFAWWHTLLVQENYDRKYFQLMAELKKLNAKLEALQTKPNEKKLMSQIQKYREQIAEKVLQKTLANRLGRISEVTTKKLKDKLNEEAMIKKDAENTWKRVALQETVDYFNSDSVKRDFMQQALQQFCSGDTAKLTKSSTTVKFETSVFSDEYAKNFEDAKKEYLAEQRSKGNLLPIFMDPSERSSKSSSEKEEEYSSRVQQWAQSHNAVNAPTPSFA